MIRKVKIGPLEVSVDLVKDLERTTGALGENDVAHQIIRIDADTRPEERLYMLLAEVMEIADWVYLQGYLQEEVSGGHNMIHILAGVLAQVLQDNGLIFIDLED